MLKKGMLYWFFNDNQMTYLRLFNFVGIGLQSVNDKILNGYILLKIIWQLEFGFNITRRRVDYVKRNEDKKSPKASA